MSHSKAMIPTLCSCGHPSPSVPEATSTASHKYDLSRNTASRVGLQDRRKCLLDD